MNTLLLQPSDILFFRDGRPMGGSLSGHGAAWPLPTVTNAALHAALHRASLENVHLHRRGRSGSYSDKDGHRDRKFGSLVTAGPFPVAADGTWLFPRPLDVGPKDSAGGHTAATFHPMKIDGGPRLSSLPGPLVHPVVNAEGASKDTPSPWWSRRAWQAYLEGNDLERDAPDPEKADPDFKSDSDFSDTEHAIGIGIDPATSTQDGERFYSAHYLRLRPGCRIGLLAEARDKDFPGGNGDNDLIPALFKSENHILVGGQQRVCSAALVSNAPLPLPVGKTGGFGSGGKFLVKWTLLTPAIFPEIHAGISKRGTERKAHPGGWLPTWICPETGKLLLETVGPEERKRRRNLNAGGKGYPSHPDIPATLVAAMTGKPVPVTGYALGNGLDDRAPGPKPAHLAVPAGSVYYFECVDETAAAKLAAALNWHGSETSNLKSRISNRRSTLFGEKGFGLGVCSAWSFHHANLPGHP